MADGRWQWQWQRGQRLILELRKRPVCEVASSHVLSFPSRLQPHHQLLQGEVQVQIANAANHCGEWLRLGSRVLPRTIALLLIGHLCRQPVAGLHYAARLDRSCMTTCIDEVIVDQLE